MKLRTAQMPLFPEGGARPTRRASNRKRVDVDLFAGGGGAGEGKRRATDKAPDVAINHWPVAISMYSANHPTTRVLIEDIRDVEPLEATLGALVRYLWGSPTCVHFSRASGKRLSPGAVAIRALANVLLPWLEQTQPEVAIVENVIEFLGWGPVYDTHADGCPGVEDESGDACMDACKYGRVIPELKGTLFAEWRRAIEALGYSFEYRILNAWEYGAPTTRPRVYIVMCAKGRRYEWPEPTHVRPELVAETGLKPWRTAAEIIDWSIPCPSIFDRERPHVPATRRRLAKGMRKFVLETASPFLLPVKSWGGGGNEPRSIDLPTRTTTASKRGEHALAVPYMIHMGNGERPDQEPRVYDPQAPYPTVMGDGGKARPVVAFIAKGYSERRADEVQGSDLRKPLSAVTAQDHNHLVAAHAVKFYGTSTGQDLRDPTHTITANDHGGGHIGIVAASLLRYHGEPRPGAGVRGQSPDAPISTLDASNRYAQLEYPLAAAPEWNDIIAAKARRVYRFLVEEGIEGPWLDHANQVVRLPAAPELVIYDIGMRMLVPRELFRANGFTDWSIVLTGEGWRVQPIPAEDGQPFPSGRESAERAAASSSRSSTVAADAKRVVVRARFDLRASVLELRNLARSSAPASGAESCVSCPLPSHIADSARSLAPTHQCAGRTPPTTVEETSNSNSLSTSRRSGRASAARSGGATAANANGAATSFVVSLAASRTPSTTSAAGPNSQSFDSTLRTLSSFVASAIAGSTLARTLSDASFDVVVEIADGYIIELIGPRGKPLTKTEQVRLVGNSVCPDVAEALWRAAMRMHEPRARRAA